MTGTRGMPTGDMVELPTLHSAWISLPGSTPVFPCLLRCSAGSSHSIHNQTPSFAAPQHGDQYHHPSGNKTGTWGTAWDSSSSLIGTPVVGKIGIEHWDLSLLFPPITAAGQNHIILFLTRMAPTGLPAPASPLCSLPTMLPPVTVLQNGPDSTTFLLRNL